MNTNLKKQCDTTVHFHSLCDQCVNCPLQFSLYIQILVQNKLCNAEENYLVVGPHFFVKYYIILLFVFF